MSMGMMRGRRRGVKPGYKHKWVYKSESWNEIKTAPGKWRFTFYQIKSRKVPAKGIGLPVGSKLVWKLEAYQYAVKINKNQYRIMTKGQKTLVKVTPRK